MSILITRPRHDKPTHYLFYWSKKIIDEIKKRSIDLVDLDKTNASRAKTQSYLEKNKPQIVIFNGHGSTNSVTGHDNEILISVDDNPSLLKNKIVFMRACNAGQALGPLLVEIGAKGFIGYKEKFVFLHNNSFFQRPLNDQLASPFMECSNQVAIALVKGHSAEDADKISKKMYKKKISEMLNSESENSYIIPYLLGNMKNQVCLQK